MTIIDFGKLIVKSWVVILAAALIGAGVMFAIDSTTVVKYRAVAKLTASAEAPGIGVLASSVAESNSGKGVSLTASTDTSTKTISITATSKDENASLKRANAAIKELGEKAAEIYPNVKTSVNEASKTTSNMPDKPMHALLGAGVGIIIALLLMLVIDSFRRPVRNPRQASLLAGAPVLGRIPAKDQEERLAANIIFANGGLPFHICLVPIASAKSAEEVALSCAEGFKRSGNDVAITYAGDAKNETSEVRRAQFRELKITYCNPLSTDVNGAYAASESDATLLVVRLWRDTQAKFEETLEELSIASVRVLGVIVIS